jgi:type IV secretion system protein VirD4
MRAPVDAERGLAMTIGGNFRPKEAVDPGVWQENQGLELSFTPAEKNSFKSLTSNIYFTFSLGVPWKLRRACMRNLAISLLGYLFRLLFWLALSLVTIALLPMFFTDLWLSTRHERSLLFFGAVTIFSITSLVLAAIPFDEIKAWWKRARPNSVSRKSASALGAGVVDIAGRGKSLVIAGIWFLVSLVILGFSVSPLLRAFEIRSDLTTFVWPGIGVAVGLYFLLARAVGPALIALGRTNIDTDTHGQARFATERELRKAGLIPRLHGIYLGWFLDTDNAPTEQVAYPGRVNLITIGPSGSGKGSGIIVPVLSSSLRSIFIIDPKGEAAAITARKRATFGPVHIINPFNVLAEEPQRQHLTSNGFNPLAELTMDDNFTDDCANIAQALVREQSGGDGAFFTGSARDLLTCLIMYEKVTNRDAANLGNVRKLLTEPWAGTAETGPLGIARTIANMAESDFEPLRSKAGRFRTASKSNMDIISTAANETHFMDSPAIDRDLRGAAFDWQSMKRGPGVTTVYLILPADRLETHANYLRLVVTCALRALLRSEPGTYTLPVLFMLDEFAQLGYMPSIENAMGISRGFGVALWPFLQDLNQLKALYKDRWQTFIGNAEVLTAFAPGDVFTAEYLSRRCGHKTVIVESESERIGASGEGRQRGPQGVPLIRPEELMAMPARQMLCFVKPVTNPFFTTAPPYTDDLFFRSNLNSNPYHRG